MFNHQVIEIGNEIDIINARILVRQAARRLGMKLIDQSRISLATSSLADAVGLGTGRSVGNIAIDYLHRNEDNRQGLQVTCCYKPFQRYDLVQAPLANLRWMVDECKMTNTSDLRVQVTLVMWLNN